MSKKNNHTEQPAGGMEELTPRDEALFQQLGKTKKKKKHKIIRTVVIVVMVVAIVLVAGVGILQRRVRDRFASAAGEVLSYKATSGTISTVVSGSGTLQNVDTETVTVPTGVDVTEILVDFGDEIAEGDLLATVDMATVRTAMSDLQTQIEELDEQISEAEGDKVSSYIQAGVAGRVKRIYAEKNMAVADVMVSNGALAVISLDGFMTVDIETDAVAVGESVTVVRGDGSVLDGTVESAAAGRTTILVTDNGPVQDEEVTVKTEDGAQIGTGRLYIHNPLSVTGYAGTVSNVNVRENQNVYATSTLFTLTDTGSSANYDALLRERNEAEQTLLELLMIQRNGGVAATISGSIFSVGDADDETLTDVVTISPDVSMSVTITVDESDILSLELDQKADVTVSSVSEDVLTGTVTEIDKTAASGYYTAVITLDKTPGMLPGMTASVDVRIEGVDDAIIIPVEALHQTSTGAYVYTGYDEETQQYSGRVDVVTGLSNNNYVEIKSGLKEGDTVYYTESQTLADIFAGMGFGNMPGGSGNMSGGNFGGSGSMAGGNFGGSGERPDFSGSEMPDFGGNMPGGRG